MDFIKKPSVILFLVVLDIIGIIFISMMIKSDIGILTGIGLFSGQNTSGSQTPPAAAIAACMSKAVGDVCTFNDKNGVSTGACDDKPGIIACAPSKNLNNDKAPDGIGSVQTNTSAITTTTTTSTIASCINNTKDNPQCKDCCDCLSGTDSSTRTSCRNTCATHDFAANSGFIAVISPSVLGADGDYSQCTQATDSNSCKICCENTLGLQCGDYRFCRTSCNVTYASGDTTAK